MAENMEKLDNIRNEFATNLLTEKEMLCECCGWFETPEKGTNLKGSRLMPKDLDINEKFRLEEEIKRMQKKLGIWEDNFEEQNEKEIRGQNTVVDQIEPKVNTLEQRWEKEEEKVPSITDRVEAQFRVKKRKAEDITNNSANIPTAEQTLENQNGRRLKRNPT